MIIFNVASLHLFYKFSFQRLITHRRLLMNITPHLNGRLWMITELNCVIFYFTFILIPLQKRLISLFFIQYHHMVFQAWIASNNALSCSAVLIGKEKSKDPFSKFLNYQGRRIPWGTPSLGCVSPESQPRGPQADFQVFKTDRDTFIIKDDFRLF